MTDEEQAYVHQLGKEVGQELFRERYGFRDS